MGFYSFDCGDNKHTCTAWDGNGVHIKSMDGKNIPNHNLVGDCPKNITTCEYRVKNTLSKKLKGVK